MEKRSSGKASRWALFVLVPWMVLILACLYHWHLELQLDKTARTTIGVITGIELHNHYQYDYSYAVAGTNYTGGEIIPGNTSIGVGEQVRVTYNPDAPQTSTLGTFGEVGTRPVPILVCLLGGLLCYVKARRLLNSALRM